MKSLGATTADLARLRKRFGRPEARTASGVLGPVALVETSGFGPNPGALRMLSYAPTSGPARPALVVVLHGCTQTAAAYAQGSGWAALADRLGFVLVCPEQTSANNANTCFNWFNPEDVRRGGGEVASIRQMIAHAMAAHDCDPSRVFVTGLSAGGAMAAAMLSAYPEVFAAGAIIAGLPYRAADNVREAFGYMFQAPPRAAAAWGDLVRAGSGHTGAWPKLSIWHGDQDNIVTPQTAGELVKQWTNVHGLSATPDRRERLGPHTREVWLDSSGREVVESYTVAGLGHGTPISSGHGIGTAGPYILESTISSTELIAQSWGLDAHAGALNPPLEAGGRRQLAAVEPTPLESTPRPDGALASHVEEIIHGALKAAGLMKG